MRAVVVALADLGRCARMQYHARALADNGVDVALRGPRRHTLAASDHRSAADHGPPDHTGHVALSADALPSATPAWPPATRSASRSDCGGTFDRCRVRIWSSCRTRRHFPRCQVTWLALRRRGRPVRHRLAQPRIHAAAAAARAVASRGARGPLVRAAGRAGASTPACACRAAWSHFSRAGSASRSVQVLYDRPASVFVPMDRDRRASDSVTACSGAWASSADPPASSSAHRAGPRTKTSTSSSTRCCGSKSGSAAGRRSGAARRFPQLIILVTGDGQRRAEFERRFAGLPARRVHLRARWLEPDEYPLVVGSADVGPVPASLHRRVSTSR